MLTDALRNLIDIRNERLEQIERLQATLKQSAGPIALSSEEITTLLRQHLDCRGSSRLPVLMIAAAYDSVGKFFGEFRKPLHSHTAADEQTGSYGDLEIIVQNDDRVCTAYEMKHKRVTADDIDRAIQKMGNGIQRIDNYLFVTTDVIESSVEEYARSQFHKIGSEVAIVDWGTTTARLKSRSNACRSPTSITPIPPTSRPPTAFSSIASVSFVISFICSIASALYF